MSKCRNCNTCALFPCNYYKQFNVDRDIGCMDWTDEIKQSYLSNKIVEYSKPIITDGTNCEKANLTVDTQYEKEKRPILKEENGKFYVAEEGINQYGERYAYWLPISKELYLFLKNKGAK